MNSLRDMIIQLLKGHIPFNNKGILIPLYFIICAFVVPFVFDIFQINITGLRKNHDAVYIIMAAICLATAACIYFTRTDFYKDKEGNKIKIDLDNRFLHIRWIYWVYIFVLLAIVFLVKAYIL